MQNHEPGHSVSRRGFLTLTFGAAAGFTFAGSPEGIAAEVKASPRGGPAGASAAVKRGGRLVMAHTGDILNLDATQAAGANWPIFNQLYNVLVRYDEHLKPQPELAESFRMAADGVSLNLKLRKGVRFHSGREFDSRDVAFNVEHYKAQKTAANIRQLVLPIKAVDTPDPLTAILRFEKSYPVVFDALDLMFIVDRNTVAEIKNKPVGTGPFKLGSWDPGNAVTFRRFEGYWRAGYPLLDEVVVRAMPDIDSMLVAFESGALDLIQQPRYQAIASLKAKKDMRVVAGTPGATVLCLIMNTGAKPFTDRRVRQAINYACDRRKFVEVYLAGIGEPWVTPWFPTSMAYESAQATRYSFSLEKAKQLLAEAGYERGRSLRTW